MHDYNYNIATVCYILSFVFISIICGYFTSDYSHIPFVLSAVFIGASVNQYIGHSLKEDDGLKRVVRTACIGFGVYAAALLIIMVIRLGLNIVGMAVLVAAAAVGIYIFSLTGKYRREASESDDLVSFMLSLSSLISVIVLFAAGIGALFSVIKSLFVS